MSDSEFWSDENREIDHLTREPDQDGVSNDVDDERTGSDADDRSIDLDLDPDPYATLDFDNDDRY